MGNMGNRGRNEFLSDFVVFDLETTGINCDTDRIIEISAVKVLEGQVADDFSTLVNPGCSIPLIASQVNGITDDMVASAPFIEDVLPEFLDFIGEQPLVGHNIHSFDLKFINRDCKKYLGRTVENDSVDTLKLARACLPELRHHTLTDLAMYFGVSTDGAHRALNDCRMTLSVYENLGRLIKEKPDMIRKCPKCGDILTKRKGRYGSFWGCNGYPECRYTQNI